MELTLAGVISISSLLCLPRVVSSSRSSALFWSREPMVGVWSVCCGPLLFSEAFPCPGSRSICSCIPWRTLLVLSTCAILISCSLVFFFALDELFPLPLSFLRVRRVSGRIHVYHS